MKSASTDFHVIGLQQRAAVLIPIRLQAQDRLLEGGRLTGEDAFRNGAGCGGHEERKRGRRGL